MFSALLTVTVMKYKSNVLYIFFKTLMNVRKMENYVIMFATTSLEPTIVTVTSDGGLITQQLSA